MNPIVAKLFLLIKPFLSADKLAEVEAALKDFKVDEPTPQLTPPDTSKLSPEVKVLFDSFQAEINILKQSNADLIKTIGDETNTRKASVAEQLKIAEAEKTKKINDAVDKAIKTDKKYPESERDALTKAYTADYDSTDRLVNAASTNKLFVPEQKKDANGKEIPASTYSPATPLERVTNVALRDKVRAMSQEPSN